VHRVRGKKWWTLRELNPCPSGGKEKWTHTQRIRALAEIPIEVAILDTSTPPIYENIAPKALQLQQLGMNKSAIARRLGVTDRTVAKAIAWLGRVGHRPAG
jgi:hypothetical protein